MFRPTLGNAQGYKSLGFENLRVEEMPMLSTETTGVWTLPQSTTEWYVKVLDIKARISVTLVLPI
jgi:hypothetical protein